MITKDGFMKIRQELTETESLREYDLLCRETDMYGIYQIMDDGVSGRLKYMDMEFLKDKGEHPKREGYLLVYTAELVGTDTLDDIFFRFNIKHPKDFYGHSLSVSDVVILHKQGKCQAFYVDSVGFKEIPEFFGHFCIFVSGKMIEQFAFNEMRKAFTVYFALPKNQNNTLVFQSFRGIESLLLKCENGMDMLVENHTSCQKRIIPEVSYSIREAWKYLLMNEPEEMAFKLPGQKGYFLIQTCSDGFDYTICDADYKEVDGGQLDTADDPNADGEVCLMYQAVKELLEEIDSYSENLEVMDFQELLEKVEAANHIPFQSAQMEREWFRMETNQRFQPIQGKTALEIEQAVLDYARSKVLENGLDAEIVDAVVYGSRSRGMENHDSDVDVAVEYKGRHVREDFLFDLLHEDDFLIGDIPVDINPICENEAGDFEKYLQQAERCLVEKNAL